MRRHRRKEWTEAELAILKIMYSTNSSQAIAIELKRPEVSVQKKANALKLCRPKEYKPAPRGRKPSRQSLEYIGDFEIEEIKLWNTVQKKRAIARNNPKPLWRTFQPRALVELASQVTVI